MLHYDHSPGDLVFFDIETQSDADLKSVGGRAYASHPSTRLLSLVALIDGVYHCWCPTHLWPGEPPKLSPCDVWPDTRGEWRDGLVVLHFTAEMPQVIAEACLGRTFVAHNLCHFDRAVWEKLLTPVPSRWFDTDPCARSHGFPGSLDQIGERLTGRGKDAGRSIAKKYFNRSQSLVPRPGDYAAILRYNIDDVWLLQKVYHATTTYPLEADVVVANDAINQRGVGLDVGLARSLVNLSHEAMQKAADEVATLTQGRLHAGNLRTQEVTRWLLEQHVVLPNMRRETVDRFIANPDKFVEECDDGVQVQVVPDTLRVLKLRQSALRITGSKTAAAIGRVDEGRLRDVHLYHGAHTGRFTSRGVQIHNLPRPRKGVDAAALCLLHDAGGLSYEIIAAAAALALCAPDDVLSGLVRPMLMAEPGRKLLVCDYAAVECRGLAWLAGEESLLDAFRRGEDVYCQMASRIYGRTITKADEVERQVGKIVVLGSGYGLSAAKMGLYAAAQGIDLAAAGTTPEACVGAYRKTYTAIVALWRRLEDTMKRAVESGEASMQHISFFRDGRNLITVLPSGRYLVYRDARIEDRIPGYVYTLGLAEHTKPTIVYNGPRGEDTLYGGKMCWGSETRILTRRGVVRIVDVLPGDEVWDGSEWVATDGCIFNGYKETLSWLGEQVTGDHLIYDGSKWSPVIHMDAKSSERCLSWAVDSVASLSSMVAAEKASSQRVSVIAGRLRKSTPGDSCERKSQSASGAPSRSMSGTTRRSTWTESTTTGIMNRGIFGASLEPSTLGTVVPVFDLLNCGKRHAYTVLTECGPVLSHNCENIVQAICRDLLCTALVGCEASGLPVVLHVHDEIVCEGDEAELDALASVMVTTPPWAKGFPIAVEGHTCDRYLKTPPPGSKKVKLAALDT